MNSSSNGLDLLSNGTGDKAAEYDPHYEPIITLPEVLVRSNEEHETILIQLRAKLFRHDKAEKIWKERGTGDVKLLHNETLKTVRVVMRRDKTYKLCANHYVTPDMELKSSCDSDRAWVWSTNADVSDGEPNSEILAIRFQNADAAKKWKDKFEEAKAIVAKAKEEGGGSLAEEKDDDRDSAVSDYSDLSENEGSSDDDLSKQISKISVAQTAEEATGNNDDQLPDKETDEENTSGDK
ncbi:RanBP1 domain [Nesidiocoris tenuis]|uniref:RanBP1 domain n=1 Tax=Nesidiocoris tenuis TaxID=355587 RepID=A0ABN7AZT1_9HEMI|nr:RanBP1 domain [Nesidiocoris tenuis]